MLPPALHCSVAECKFFRSLLGNCLLRLQKNCTRKGMGRLPLQLLHHQTYTYQEKFRTSKRSKTSQGTVCKYQMSPRCTSLQWAPPGSHIQSDVTISIIFSYMPTSICQRSRGIKFAALRRRAHANFGGSSSSPGPRLHLSIAS